VRERDAGLEVHLEGLVAEGLAESAPPVRSGWQQERLDGALGLVDEREGVDVILEHHEDAPPSPYRRARADVARQIIAMAGLVEAQRPGSGEGRGPGRIDVGSGEEGRHGRRTRV